ncbi:TetR family transcriptional regulator, partial [Streptomyces sp. SID11233]|nr:TetR family transcriptional regulator [Streptomyces sp. SID11233]
LATRLLYGMINSIVEWYRPADGTNADAREQERERAQDLADAVLHLAFDGLRPR